MYAWHVLEPWKFVDELPGLGPAPIHHHDSLRYIRECGCICVRKQQGGFGEVQNGWVPLCSWRSVVNDVQLRYGELSQSGGIGWFVALLPMTNHKDVCFAMDDRQAGADTVLVPHHAG